MNTYEKGGRGVPGCGSSSTTPSPEFTPRLLVGDLGLLEFLTPGSYKLL